MPPTVLLTSPSLRRGTPDGGNDDVIISKSILRANTSMCESPGGRSCVYRSPGGDRKTVSFTDEKRKLGLESYLDMSGLSLLSDRDASFPDATQPFVINKRLQLDQKLQENATRNAHFRQRFFDLQEKRLQMTMSPMCDDDRLSTSMTSFSSFTSPRFMSPGRRHRVDRFNRYKERYWRLQEKRFSHDPCLLDTSLPASLPSPLQPAACLTRTSSSPAVSRRRTSRYRSPSTKSASKSRSRSRSRSISPRKPLRTSVKQLSSRRHESHSPPRPPPRRKRPNSRPDKYDVITTIERNGDACMDVITHGNPGDTVVMSPKVKHNVAPSGDCKLAVVTVRFSYGYIKDGKLCTEF